jgi:hypothetical protein
MTERERMQRLRSLLSEQEKEGNVPLLTKGTQAVGRGIGRALGLTGKAVGTGLGAAGKGAAGAYKGVSSVIGQPATIAIGAGGTVLGLGGTYAAAKGAKKGYDASAMSPLPPQSYV